MIPWYDPAAKLRVAPPTEGLPTLPTKPSKLVRNAKVVGPVPDACPVYTKLAKLIWYPGFGVMMNSK